MNHLEAEVVASVPGVPGAGQRYLIDSVIESACTCQEQSDDTVRAFGAAADAKLANEVIRVSDERGTPLGSRGIPWGTPWGSLGGAPADFRARLEPEGPRPPGPKS